jgi:hypothetical protein
MTHIVINIRNPNTTHHDDWYLERKYRITVRRYYSLMQSYLLTYHQQVRERTLKNTAIKDLIQYIFRSETTREFIIHFLELENDYNQYSLKYRKGKWYLFQKVFVRLEDSGHPYPYLNYHNSGYTLTKKRLSKLAYDIHVVGIRFIEVIEN